MTAYRSSQADSDLDDIWHYVARESGSAEIADRLIDAITYRFLLIAERPYLGRARGDFRPGLRSFPVGEHLIMYRTDGDDVLILRVVRSSRKVDALWDR